MKKAVIAVFIFLLIIGCSQKQKETKLTDLQKEACDAAQRADKCRTGLADLELVSKDECCTTMKLCCN